MYLCSQRWRCSLRPIQRDPRGLGHEAERAGTRATSSWRESRPRETHHQVLADTGDEEGAGEALEGLGRREQSQEGDGREAANDTMVRARKFLEDEVLRPGNRL